MRRAAWPAALAAAGLMALAPAPADAAPRFTPCPELPGEARCATLRVPLDRTGAVPGSALLRVAHVRARGPRRGVVMAISGGPGQSAVADLPLFVQALAPVLGSRDLVVFDQRGTGRAGALRCRVLDRLPATAGEAAVARAVAECARVLGPRRGLYTTAASVEDLEAVRALVGAERVSLYGVSYGTKLATAYAARHPERVERVVLDSVVTPEGPDPFARSSFGALSHVLADLCARGRCRSVTRDPVGDLDRLATRLRARALRGPLVEDDGRRRTATMGAEDLLGILVSGDLDPLVRARTPAAIRSALRGDPAPVLRLARRASEQELGEQSVSAALFVATTCAEAPVPWHRAAAPAERRRQARAAVSALPPTSFAPFGRAAVSVLASQVALCARWPADPAPEAIVSGLPPQVPVLALAGRGDVRTPVADARSTLWRYRDGQLVAVPGSGHSVLPNDVSGCVGRAVARFFAGRRAGGCAAARPLVPPEHVDPTSVDVLRPAPGVAGRRGRVVRAVALTLRDTVLPALLSDPGDLRGGGLRGGSFALSRAGLVLRDVVYVPGVRVSGRVGDRGVLRVAARGASGTLRVRPDGRLVGELGGRRIATRAGLDLSRTPS